MAEHTLQKRDSVLAWDLLSDGIDRTETERDEPTLKFQTELAASVGELDGILRGRPGKLEWTRHE